MAREESRRNKLINILTNGARYGIIQMQSISTQLQYGINTSLQAK